MPSVKELVESGQLAALPPEYVFRANSGPHRNNVDNEEAVAESKEAIPTVDLSLLTSGNPDERAQAVSQLGLACREWGFFMVLNHGIERKVREEVMQGMKSFFDQSEEEKQEQGAGKSLFDPIRCGSGFNVAVDDVLLWRDYLKVHVHPNFPSSHLTTPHGFNKVLEEYCTRTRELAETLLKGVSESLGMDEDYMKEKAEMGSDQSHQLLVVNMYPPCPQPELAMGLSPHTDHGVITIIMQNEINGLQVMHDGKWISIPAAHPNSFFVNIGDHMEILTNGEYKSVVHRAVVNGLGARLSVATAHGPPLETVVRPAAELLHRLGHPPLYRGLAYREYLQMQQSSRLHHKSCLDKLRLLHLLHN